jgi:phage tail sheath gpL-like
MNIKQILEKLYDGQALSPAENIFMQALSGILPDTPINEATTYATCSLDDGENNVVVLTAKVEGEAGNFISVQFRNDAPTIIGSFNGFTALTIAVDEGEEIASLVTAINANTSLPFTAEAVGDDTAPQFSSQEETFSGGVTISEGFIRIDDQGLWVKCIINDVPTWKQISFDS